MIDVVLALAMLLPFVAIGVLIRKCMTSKTPKKTTTMGYIISYNCYGQRFFVRVRKKPGRRRACVNDITLQPPAGLKCRKWKYSWP